MEKRIAKDNAFIYFYTKPYDLQFAETKHTLEHSKIVIIGVPLDITSWHRSGCREGPKAVREASKGLEGYSLRSKIHIEDVKLHDLGDISIISGDLVQTLNRIEKVIEELSRDGKIPFLIGGEHTITLASIRALRPQLLLSFDAHLDLRDEWPSGQKISHATVMRRVSEIIGLENIVFIGARAFSREELEYIKKRDILILTPFKILERKGLRELYTRVKEVDSLYISVDMDVLEPALAPGIGDPEPEGLTFTQLLDILYKCVGENLVGFDISEIYPQYDKNITPFYAAKIIMEMACYYTLKGSTK